MGRTRRDKAAAGPVLVVRRAPRNGCRAILQLGHLAFPAAIGRGGLSVFKREGDGATPVARMQILHGYRRMDRIRQARSPLVLRNSRKSDLWCDASGHPAYNRAVQAPFSASHEEMRRADHLYDLCIVLDWNISSRKRHAGSAIFFHLIDGDYTPTAGCVALSARDMIRLLPHLRKGTVLKVLK